LNRNHWHTSTEITGTNRTGIASIVSYNYGFGVIEMNKNNILSISSCDDFRNFSAKIEARKNEIDNNHIRISLLNNELKVLPNYIMLIDSAENIKFGGVLDEQGDIY